MSGHEENEEKILFKYWYAGQTGKVVVKNGVHKYFIDGELVYKGTGGPPDPPPPPPPGDDD